MLKAPLLMSMQAGPRVNPVAALSFPVVDVKALNLSKTFKGHVMSVSSLAMHPTKPIVVCSPSSSPLASAACLTLAVLSHAWRCRAQHHAYDHGH